MKRTLSIRDTLFIVIGMLNLLIAAQTGLNTYESWVNHRNASLIHDGARTINLLYEMQKSLALERGLSISVLYAEPAPSSTMLTELGSYRDKMDFAFREASEALKDTEDFNLQSALRKAKDSYIKVRDVRYKLDSFERANPESRSAIGEEIFLLQTALISDIDNIIEMYSRPMLREAQVLARPMRFTHLIWVITEYTSREYTLIGYIMAENRQPTRLEQEQLDNWRGRIRYAWELAENVVANSVWADEIKPSMNEAATHYMMNFEQIKGSFTGRGNKEEVTYPITADMWLELAAQAVDSLHIMNDTVLASNRKFIAKYKKDAERDIVFNLMLFLAALVLSYYSWYLINKRVIYPINSIADTLYKATTGEYYELPKIANEQDEIGKLVNVLRIFQENSRELALERDRARAANVAKSDFLANMSHEIRTPMNVVVGLAGILAKSSPLTEKQKEYIQTLQLSAGSLLSLMNDLLDFSRIETQAFQLEKIPFSLDSLLHEVVTMFDAKAAEQGLAYRADLSGIKNRKYMGDPMRIRQILMNIFGNAFKFTEKGSIFVKAEAIASPKSDCEDVYISVTDTGIGIPADKLDSIFEKFTQGDSSITRKYGGTGLGLAIAKTFAEMMGGRITVDSTPGSGSTFTVYIPLPLKS